ncbi:expression library immunization antigen 1 protein [Rutstroemia sp. NJR-2017a WRK4]|nr:expression library immunization antigen 1 protein [Rutstroemia sp. NJR-2017a WRK4]
MANYSFILVALFSSIASAHFTLNYPYWRGDSFAAPASQWTYPCAGINTTVNRTLYPSTSFPIALSLHHPWTYIFVNLGLGSNVSNFNISLTPAPLNETGAGELCLGDFVLPAGITVQDGMNATLQVVTVGESGSALYNCADITFSTSLSPANNSAKANSTQCPSTPGLSLTTLTSSSSSTSNSSSTTSSTTSSPSAAKSSSAAMRSVGFGDSSSSGILGMVIMVLSAVIGGLLVI